MILSFEYPFLLLLLALLPVLLLIFLFARRRKKKMLKRLGDPLLVLQLIGNYKPSSFAKKFLLVFFAMGLLLFSLANLRTPIGSLNTSRSGTEIMIALDVSKSMLAQDIQPDRLTRAKQLLSRLVDKLPNDKIGIVVFAGRAYLQMPLTGDHAATKMYISSATPESIPTQGTVLAEALRMCNVSFTTKEKKYKSIVLISDGEDHDEDAVKTAKNLADDGVIIHTVGIGSVQGAPIKDDVTGELKTDIEGKVVITKLNEEELQKIANAGHGIYQLYSNGDAVVANITNQISTMDKQNITDDSLINFQSFFQLFIGVAFLLLLLELFVSEVRKKKLKTSKVVPLAMILLCFTMNAFAQNEKPIIKDGNKAYNNNDYDAAAAEYSKALKENENSVPALYNFGNALYKTGKKDESIAAYDQVIKSVKDPQQLSHAYYNKGVVLQNDKKLEECIAAYKDALRLLPNDDDARQNLQKALQKQKQDQKQNQDKDKDKNKDKNNPDKPDQNKDQKPKPQPSKLSQQQAEDKLKALMQQEKNLQDKLHKTNAQSPEHPEKDW